MHQTMGRGLVLCALYWAQACGRSPISLDDDDAAVPDLVVAGDQSVRVDHGSSVDALLPADHGPCHPGCVDRCKLLTGCNLYPKGATQCLADCPGWSAALSLCLDGLICGSKACQAAATCITSPPVTDLAINQLKASVKGTTVTYSFTVCNLGQLPGGGFEVALYHNSKTAPMPKQTGNAVLPVPTGLGGGICAPLTMQRHNTPPGSYASWIQVDAKAQVAESDESNNVAGPVAVTIPGPTQPDLMIKSFTAKLVGADVVYDVELCNIGTAASWLFRVEIYYNRLLAPSVFMVGDQNAMFLTGLAAGACKTISRTYTNAKVGMLRSWAQVDSLNTVKESNEANNVAGPRLIVVSAQSGCIALCSFATSCGLFTVTEFAQCLTWCNGLSTSQRTCADTAATKSSCADLKQCPLPPPPPPPPPPWACLQICNYLVNTCKLVPSNQYLTCTGGCITLPQTKVQCAMTAMSNKQCLALSLCLF